MFNDEPRVFLWYNGRKYSKDINLILIAGYLEHPYAIIFNLMPVFFLALSLSNAAYRNQSIMGKNRHLMPLSFGFFGILIPHSNSINSAVFTRTSSRFIIVTF